MWRIPKAEGLSFGPREPKTKRCQRVRNFWALSQDLWIANPVRHEAVEKLKGQNNLTINIGQNRSKSNEEAGWGYRRREDVCREEAGGANFFLSGRGGGAKLPASK